MTVYLQFNSSNISPLSDHIYQIRWWFLFKFLLVCKRYHCSPESIPFIRQHLQLKNYDLSRVVRKRDYCLCKNKGADQFRGNPKADQRLCFRYSESTIPHFLNQKFKASSCVLWLYSPLRV